MSRDFWSVPSYISASAVSAAKPGLPIGIGGFYSKAFAISTDNYQFDIPAGQAPDLEQLMVTFSCTAETGTTPTIDVDLQGVQDPCSQRTQINMASGLAIDGTTLTVDTGHAIAAASPLLLASFTLVDGIYKLSKYEWVLATAVSTNDITIDRSFYGSTGDNFAFSDNDFVFYSNSWATMKDSSGNDIKLNDLSIDGATASAPKMGTIDTVAEGLTGLPTPFFRVLVAASSSNAATYTVDLAGRAKAACA